MENKIVQQLFIDSTNLRVTNHFDFKTQLNERLVVNEYIKLTKAVIPFDNLMIDNLNNKISIDSNTYYLPIGNFSLTDLLSNLASTIGSTFTVTFSKQTYKITITNKTTFALTLNTDLAFILGFKNTQYSGSAFYIAEQTPSISSPPVVLINIKEIPDCQAIQACNYDSPFSFLILNPSQRGQNIQYQNKNEENTLYFSGSINSISVELRKNNGTIFQIQSPIQLFFEYY